jgi:predicted nuclease with TOPRIM domain
MSTPQPQTDDDELERLKQCIAEVVANRESLKQDIESKHISASEGLRRLEILDRELSALDSAFKKIWDAQQL